MRVMLTYIVFPVKLFLQTDNCFSVAMRLNYTVGTPTRGHWEEDFPITTFSESKRFSSKQTNVIQVFNYPTVENFKTA